VANPLEPKQPTSENPWSSVRMMMMFGSGSLAAAASVGSWPEIRIRTKTAWGQLKKHGCLGGFTSGDSSESGAREDDNKCRAGTNMQALE
jgi:hypothetical protein